MANPLSNSAMYFSHDADMRNDIKVKALRRKFAHKGYAVWCFILETLTDREDFEAEFDEVSQELLASDFDITVEELQDIVNYCCKINLLQLSDNRLYSEAHKRRFEDINIIREKRSRAGKMGAEKRWGAQADAQNGKPMARDSTAIATDGTPITKMAKIEEKIIEENRKEKKNIEYPCQDIVRLWNEICLSLPKVVKLNDNRRTKIKCRLSESGAKTPEEMLAWAKSLFSRCQASSFLRGDNNSNWTATFDWIFENPSNWVKVSEGNYDNNRGLNRGLSGVENLLGDGEYLRPDGTRTYGSGKANIPLSAPRRPSSRHQWSTESQSWILL